MEKIQPYILTPWGNVVRCQCSIIFFIQRAKIWNASTFLKQKWFQTILYLRTTKCYINLLPYLLIITIPFDHKNSLVWQGRYISKVRNLKCRDVKSFAHCKREKIITRTYVFLLLWSSQIHSELCLNLLNLYLESWELSFICSVTNCGTEKLLHLYWSYGAFGQDDKDLPAFQFYNSNIFHIILTTKGSEECEFTYIK